MRRLLVLPLLVAAGIGTAAPASADPQPGDNCNPVTLLGTETVAPCAGVRCNDICGPEPYAYVTCSSETIQARCRGIGVS